MITKFIRKNWGKDPYLDLFIVFVVVQVLVFITELIVVGIILNMSGI